MLLFDLSTITDLALKKITENIPRKVYWIGCPHAGW